MDAVAAQGSKSRLVSLAGMVEVISANVANRPFPFEDLPELIDTERCLPSEPEDIAVRARLYPKSGNETNVLSVNYPRYIADLGVVVTTDNTRLRGSYSDCLDEERSLELTYMCMEYLATLPAVTSLQHRDCSMSTPNVVQIVTWSCWVLFVRGYSVSRDNSQSYESSCNVIWREIAPGTLVSNTTTLNNLMLISEYSSSLARDFVDKKKEEGGRERLVLSKHLDQEECTIWR